MINALLSMSEIDQKQALTAFGAFRFPYRNVAFDEIAVHQVHSTMQSRKNNDEGKVRINVKDARMLLLHSLASLMLHLLPSLQRLC